MTQEVLESTIKHGPESKWEGCNCYQGLQIIAKYIDPAINTIVAGASHDEVGSVDTDVLAAAGITVEDANALCKLNWIVEDGYLVCYV